MFTVVYLDDVDIEMAWLVDEAVTPFAPFCPP